MKNWFNKLTNSWRKKKKDIILTKPKTLDEIDYILEPWQIDFMVESERIRKQKEFNMSYGSWTYNDVQKEFDRMGLGYYKKEDNKMTQTEWDKMGRIGYGKRYYQEFSLDEKGFVYCLTHEYDKEFPEHLPYILETIEVAGVTKRGTIYKIALAE